MAREKKKRRQYIPPWELSSEEEENVTREKKFVKPKRRRSLNAKEVRNNFLNSLPSTFIKVISQFDEKKRKAVQEIGFGSLLELKCSHLDIELCRYLISRLDCGSHRLRLGDEKSIGISALDIESILGLPRTQLPVPDNPTRASWIEAGGFSRENGRRVSTLAKKLLKLDGAGDEFKRTFVLFACGTILSPNSRREAYVKLLRAVHRVDQIRTYNWCQYVLNCLLTSIENISTGTKSCNGCLVFLQFFYLMRFDIKDPSPKGDVQCIGVWTDELIKARIIFEKEQLGGFGRCQVSTSLASSSLCPTRLQIPTSTRTPSSAKRRKSMDHIYNSMSKSKTSNDVQQLQNLPSKKVTTGTAQTREAEEIEPAAALSTLHTAVTDNNLARGGAYEASNIVGSGLEGTANNDNQREEHLGQSSSPNVTGMDEMVDNASCDYNEVNGYRVKREWAFLLNAIFRKYGDITKDSSLVTSLCRSTFLDMICEMIKELQDTEFTKITTVELESKLDVVRDMERVKLEVGWLHQRLDDISEAKHLSKGYSGLRKTRAKTMQLIERKEEELKGFNVDIVASEEEIRALQGKIRTLQEKVLLTESELTPMKAEAKKIDEKVSETEAKLNVFDQKALVHDLL